MREEIRRLELRLAACSAVALGHTEIAATPDHECWSPVYADVLALRRRFDETDRDLTKLQRAGQITAAFGERAIASQPGGIADLLVGRAAGPFKSRSVTRIGNVEITVTEL